MLLHNAPEQIIGFLRTLLLSIGRKCLPKLPAMRHVNLTSTVRVLIFDETKIAILK